MYLAMTNLAFVDHIFDDSTAMCCRSCNDLLVTAVVGGLNDTVTRTKEKNKKIVIGYVEHTGKTSQVAHSIV